MMLTFDFAYQSNINQGVIAGLFASNIFYTAILFRIAYSENLSCIQYISMLLIFGGVMCVTYRDEKSNISSYSLLFVSVVMSQLTSLTFSLTTFIIKVQMKQPDISDL